MTEDIIILMGVIRSLATQKTIFVVKLLAINLGITFLSEVVIRELGYLLGFISDSAYRLFQHLPNGAVLLNQQSAVNLTMTFLATLMSIKAFHLEANRRRYIYFVFCCFALSLIAQLALTHISRNYTVSALRLGFDIMYGMTVKYAVFVLYRTKILESIHTNIKDAIKFRVSQDLLLSCIKFLCLRGIGLKG